METDTVELPKMKPEEIAEFMRQIDEIMKRPIPLYTAELGSRFRFTR